ncbi:hypothetical protein [Ferrovibrio sp.]|uniref:hypothetical protein n=1 Tax=Ferrovibrio sp. TaxID=1917215 RepID=UPI0035B341E9
MAISDHSLRALLRASSSRMFDLQRKHRELLANQEHLPGRPGPSRPVKGFQPFFTNRNANRLVILKYAPPVHERHGLVNSRAVQTKLYLPFNEANLEEGGKTILLSDAKLEQALDEQLAMSSKRDPAGFRRDRAVLDVLDSLPSLDPFLMRDKLEIESIAVDEGYFAFPPGELDAIKVFVRDKMAKVARFAASEGAEVEASAVERLTQILWDAKDAAAMKPIAQTFGIDITRAPEIVYSWKGIIFYDRELSQQRAEWQKLLDWLGSEARPRDGANPALLKDMAELRKLAYADLSGHWRQVNDKLERYRECFDELFLRKKEARPFMDFLRNAKQLFWELGDSLSRLSHSHAVWERATERYTLRRLPATPLWDLLDTLYRINAE